MAEEVALLTTAAEEAKTALTEVKNEVAAERLKVKKAAEDRYAYRFSADIFADPDFLASAWRRSSQRRRSAQRSSRGSAIVHRRRSSPSISRC